MKTDVYEFHCRLVAFEANNDPSLKNHGFFILDEDQTLHQIEKSPKHDKYECTRTFDYKGYNLKEVIANDWSPCHISSQSVTYNDIVFKANSNQPKA